MGACQSCIGFRSRRNAYEEDEENRLLYEDGNSVQYGSFGEAALNGENDTAEAQREVEALQRVVAKASSNMVDVFEIEPQDPAARSSSTPFTYAAQNARTARYQHLMSKLRISAEDDHELTTADVKVDWVADEDNIELRNAQVASFKALDKDEGPLVGTFADAAAAMQ